MPGVQRTFLMAVLGAGMAMSLSACVVAPVAYREPPPRVAYVAPTYPCPGPGWVWAVHPAYGWGWHHPARGWHRGWRD